MEALDQSDFPLKQKFICSLNDRFQNQLMFEDPISFSRAKELAGRAEDLFRSQDKNTLNLRGESTETGKIRALLEPAQQGLGKIYSADPDDQKQILGEVQERLA